MLKQDGKPGLSQCIGSAAVLVVANAASLPPVALKAIMVVTNDSNMTTDFNFITILLTLIMTDRITL
jgi:hypothetical protein